MEVFALHYFHELQHALFKIIDFIFKIGNLVLKGFVFFSKTFDLSNVCAKGTNVRLDFFVSLTSFSTSVVISSIASSMMV